ncbi:Serine/threonine-protein phosphatase 7 long form-like [Senna tora]|uniref:Serine/threonine-protein phosphatase 7 long form-like n=1 Tax=Senna tora TaxID=362788 RepID=A0A834WTV2_9FABA|nr:Serine/threonine-protein phosphatase 7 long form-like [Senna tora]
MKWMEIGEVVGMSMTGVGVAASISGEAGVVCSLASLPLRWRGIGPQGQHARAQLIHGSGVGSSTGTYSSLWIRFESVPDTSDRVRMIRLSCTYSPGTGRRHCGMDILDTPTVCPRRTRSTTYGYAPPAFVPLLISSDFYGAFRASYFPYDWHLVTAFIMRWRPETHMFHMAVGIGETTITLEDVAIQLGLPIEGKAVNLEEVGQYSWGSTILAYLFREMCEATRWDCEIKGRCAHFLLAWAWDRFRTLAPRLRGRKTRKLSAKVEAAWYPVPCPLSARWSDYDTTMRQLCTHNVMEYVLKMDNMSPANPLPADEIAHISRHMQTLNLHPDPEGAGDHEPTSAPIFPYSPLDGRDSSRSRPKKMSDSHPLVLILIQPAEDGELAGHEAGGDDHQDDGAVDDDDDDGDADDKLPDPEPRDFDALGAFLRTPPPSILQT